MKKYTIMTIILIILGLIITIITGEYNTMITTWLAVIAYNQLEILDTIKAKNIN